MGRSYLFSFYSSSPKPPPSQQKNAQKITLVENDKKTPQEDLRRFSKLTFRET
jgi:hypothetical protein